MMDRVACEEAVTLPLRLPDAVREWVASAVCVRVPLQLRDPLWLCVPSGVIVLLRVEVCVTL